MEKAIYAYFLMGGYLALHCGIFFLVLRNIDAFQKERNIFLYHFVSAIASALIISVAYALGFSSAQPEILAGLFAMHGIYSLSFLELWALSDDSYSLAILKRIHEEGPIIDTSRLADLLTIGERKQRNRLSSLVQIRLLELRGDIAELTGLGRMVARLARVLLCIARIGQQG